MAELPLDDGTLWYESRGDGRPLVFIHGGWMNGEAWAPQVERFADEYEVITFDVRGHGKTGATAVDRYTIDLFADDLEALLAHLDRDEAPVLCGLSLGSMVVQEFVDRHPDRAAGAILGGAVRSMPPVELPPGTKPFVSPMPALATTLSLSGPATTFRTMLSSIRATTGEEWLTVDPDVRSQAMDAVRQVERREFRKVFGALYRYEPTDLSHVETPTLIVHGEQEAPLVKRQGRRLADEIERGDLLEFDESGHLVNLDRPNSFNHAAETFLERTAT
ncbi:alpha/beta fold hydrolase [Natronolimnohabitans innermongolicus]|uniref:Alpha/beta hydrolase fold protein n=1 Tax=Natronolimnohabitans innermongolicus JCM 12255 TaxID=1227499 RepID=L9XIG5_9EURY|nr:alpha/beta hydrolase [Natronolimnohabitans innermongolicus]ELY61211.1 alpha/beta hydrolase fold protein [Natronolimnohabitans innermongolicus JCM 12255]